MKYKKKELDAVELGNGLILCEKSGRRLHRLNNTAAEIWKVCDGERDVSDIAAHLAREFSGAPEEKLESDVQSALVEMRRLGILDSCG